MIPQGITDITAQTLVLVGNVQEGDRTIKFELGLALSVSYFCWEYIRN